MDTSERPWLQTKQWGSLTRPSWVIILLIATTVLGISWLRTAPTTLAVPVTSNFTLFLEEGAIILRSQDPSEWPVVDPLLSYGEEGRDWEDDTLASSMVTALATLSLQDPSEWPVVDPLPSYGRGRKRLGGRHISLIHGDGISGVVSTGTCSSHTQHSKGRLRWR